MATGGLLGAASMFGVKLQVEPPHKYDGTKPYEDWSKRFTNYMCLQDQRFGKLLKWASGQPDEICDLELDSISGGSASIDDLTKMSTLIYYLLSGLLTGAPFVLLDQIQDQNGVEVWRKLYQRYAKTKTQSLMSTLMKIVNTKFTEDNFEATLAQWENDVSKFELVIGKELYPEIKTGLLVINTTGKLYDHLRLTTNTMTDYA